MRLSKNPKLFNMTVMTFDFFFFACTFRNVQINTCTLF